MHTPLNASLLAIALVPLLLGCSSDDSGSSSEGAGGTVSASAGASSGGTTSSDGGSSSAAAGTSSASAGSDSNSGAAATVTITVGAGESCGSLSVVCADGLFCNFPVEELCGDAPFPLGTCTAPAEICTEEYSPVCGCDGETYSNACFATGASVSVSSEGACS